MSPGRTRDFAISQTWSQLSTETTQLAKAEYRRTRGVVVTPAGIVSVDGWRPTGEAGEAATYFRFVYDGREYGRRDARVYASHRALATVAARWAREIAGGAP